MELQELRDQINLYDEVLSATFVKRMDAAMQVARYKKEHNMPVLDATREREVINRVTENRDEAMLMPSITICTFLTITNGFKLFDQNLALTSGMPSEQSQMLALNIFQTFYGRNGWAGAGQAKAVVFCLLVVLIALVQLRLTRTKEVQQ